MGEDIATHRHYLGGHTSFNWQRTRTRVREVEALNLGRYRQFNAKTAVLVTHILGSMEFFWFSNLLALVSLPAVLALLAPGLHSVFPDWLIKLSLISFVSWIAQTYIQLVALSVLQVSGNAQAHQLESSVREILENQANTLSEVQALREAVVGKNTPARRRTPKPKS